MKQQAMLGWGEPFASQNYVISYKNFTGKKLLCPKCIFPTYNKKWDANILVPHFCNLNKEAIKIMN